MSADLIPNILAYAVVIVGAARLIVQAIAKVTAITPGTGDDEVVTTAEKWIARIQSVLGTIALPSHAPAISAAKTEAKRPKA